LQEQVFLLQRCYYYTHTHRLWQKVRKREREKTEEKKSENEER
jgi:hypothetical protein